MKKVIIISRFNNGSTGYKNYKDIDINVIKKYLNNGLNIQQIAKKLNVGIDKIRRIIIKNNIDIIWSCMQVKLNKINSIKQEDFEYYYYETNLTINEICKKLKIGMYIYHALRKKYSCNEKGKIYYEKNKDRLLKEGKEKRKQYDIIHKKEFRERARLFYKSKYYNDMNYKISTYICNSIRHRIKHHKGTKAAKTEVLLGCNIQQFRDYLQNQFKPGMNWENFGFRGWHMDHKKPCCSFDLTKLEEQKKCFHYTNYQPLWWYENMNKLQIDRLLSIKVK